MPFGSTSVPLLCDHIIKAQLREGVGGGWRVKPRCKRLAMFCSGSDL